MSLLSWADLPDDVKALYPWPGKDHTTPAGHRQHYVDEGEGPPMVLVHGNPTWSFYWRDLVKAFAGAPGKPGFRCVVPDHVGHGLSEKPEEWTYRLSDHADNLVALIERLDLRDVTLVVHDWGGAIGFAAALRVPERIGRLVVLNTSVFMEHVPFRIRFARNPGVGELLVRRLNGFVRGGLVTAIGDRSKLAGAVGRGYLAPYATYAERVGHLRFIRDIPVEDDHPTRATIQHLTAEVPKTFAKTPTLFLWGDRDFVFTPAFLEKWRALLPHGEVHRFPTAGHWVVEDETEAIVAKMRDFLSRHPPGRA